MPYPVAGLELGGSPIGAGSAFHVRRAFAVGGQLVRVVFAIEPKHAGTAGLDDARNASLYAIEIVTGTGHAVSSIAIRSEIVQYPAFGMLSGEYAVDLQLDRPVVIGLIYRVTVSGTMRAKDGTAIGSPYSATFEGATRPKRTRQIRRRIGLVDLASDPFTGGIIVDNAGDWASHEGLDGTKKRVWRCALTAKRAFSWLPNLGLEYDIKLPGTITVLANLRTDMRQQLGQQPDIKSSEVGATMDARGFLSLSIKGQSSSGEEFGDRVAFGSEGKITIP